MLNGLALDQPVKSLSGERQPSLDELRAECAGRAHLYRLLAGAFIEEPSREYVTALRAPEALASLAELGVRFDSDFLDAELDSLMEQLATEYTTMFAASGGFPPVESVRLTGRYQQEPFFQVRQAYRRAGFEVGKGRFFVFDDQLGVELLFVAKLLERGAEALEQGDSAAYARVDREVKRFWALHLGRWVRGYARLAARATEHSLFREMAKLLLAFAEDEIATMKLRIVDEDGGREVVPPSEVKVAFNPDEPICNGCTLGPTQNTAA